MFMPPRARYGTAPMGGLLDPEEDEMLKRFYADVPEYRKRKRRVEKLRGRRDTLQKMADSDPAMGSYGPDVQAHGNWHAIPGAYIPNYSGMAQKAIGALGGAWADRKGGELEGAEGEYDTLQSQKLLEDALLIGRRARAERAAGRNSSNGSPDTYGGY